jgi:cytochrome c5
VSAWRRAVAAALVLGAGAMLAFGAIAQTKPAPKSAAPATRPATAPGKSGAPAATKPGAAATKPAAAAPEAEAPPSSPYPEQPAAPAKKPYPAVFPNGPGKAIADNACLFCHSAMLVTQQAKDSTAWEKTLTQMIAWGAPIDTVDRRQRDSLRVYLLAHFGPRPMLPTPAAAPTQAPKK